jgi:chromosome segregation ATPase
MRRLKKGLSEYIQLVAGAVGAGLAIFALIEASNMIMGFRQETAPQKDEIVEIKNQLQVIERGLKNVESQVMALSKVPEQSGISGQLGSLNNSVDSLQSRFTRIEGLIVQDPSKALEIPLLRKDIETIKDSNQTSIAGLRQDIERAYTLLIGTMVALAIAVLAPAVSNMFRKRATATE